MEDRPRRQRVESVKDVGHREVGDPGDEVRVEQAANDGRRVGDPAGRRVERVELGREGGADGRGQPVARLLVEDDVASRGRHRLEIEGVAAAGGEERPPAGGRHVGQQVRDLRLGESRELEPVQSTHDRPFDPAGRTSAKAPSPGSGR